MLHSACVFDNYKIVKTIIEQTKKRLNLTPESSLSNEEKLKNEKFLKILLILKQK